MNLKIKIIDDQKSEPLENFKTEEGLFAQLHGHDYLLRFWKNSPCIVMGRFQDERFEINAKYLSERTIPIIKRMSGGGTVYHDLGTLNISFLKLKAPPLSTKQKESDSVTLLIQKALQTINIETNRNERNALFIGEQKVLGSAALYSRGIFHYHASLLISANLEALRDVIKWDEKYNEKTERPFTKSFRSPVTNILDQYRDLSEHQIREAIRRTFTSVLMADEQ